MPQLDIIMGLRVEIQRFNETLRTNNLQNCEATSVRNVSWR